MSKPEPTRKLILEIDENIYQSLCNALLCKVGCGNLFGELDEFATLTLKAMKDGKESLHIIKKAPKPKRRKPQGSEIHEQNHRG